MECRECEKNRGEPVEIEYFDGTCEEIPLCKKCRDGFQDGELVDDVSPPELEED